MANKIDFNDSLPNAPANRVNVKWQFDAIGNVSAHVPISSNITIQDEASALPQRNIIDFVGAGVTATDNGTKTIITIPGGGGGSQTPWLSNIDANNFDLNNLKSLNMQSALGRRISIYGDYSFGIQSNILQIIVPGGGDRVGIGSGNSTSFNENLTIMGNGNVGFGVTNPQTKIDSIGMIRTTGANPIPASGIGVEMLYDTGNDKGFLQAYNRATGTYKRLEINADPLLLTRQGGNVSIGDLTPSYKLDIAGDCNITGSYRVNGVPLALGQNQTPWLTNIDGNFKTLNNVDIINFGTRIYGPYFDAPTFGYFGINVYYDSGWKYRANGSGMVLAIGSGSVPVILTAPAGTAGSAATLTETVQFWQGITRFNSDVQVFGNFHIGYINTIKFLTSDYVNPKCILGLSDSNPDFLRFYSYVGGQPAIFNLVTGDWYFGRYIFATQYNTAIGNEDGASFTSIYCSYDNYIRKASLDWLNANLIKPTWANVQSKPDVFYQSYPNLAVFSNTVRMLLLDIRGNTGGPGGNIVASFSNTTSANNRLVVGMDGISSVWMQTYNNLNVEAPLMINPTGGQVMIKAVPVSSTYLWPSSVAFAVSENSIALVCMTPTGAVKTATITIS